jgi:hypothetical protein
MPGRDETAHRAAASWSCASFLKAAMKEQWVAHIWLPQQESHFLVPAQPRHCLSIEYLPGESCSPALFLRHINLLNSLTAVHCAAPYWCTDSAQAIHHRPTLNLAVDFVFSARLP